MYVCTVEVTIDIMEGNEQKVVAQDEVKCYDLLFFTHCSLSSITVQKYKKEICLLYVLKKLE